ncbi:MAG: hypothetical protein KDD60_12860 [Bdellovibrionales bacterium]|nr:hypothetical protein [Bdellovibrionales bacterium]
MDPTNKEHTKEDILKALSHPEASDGLYLENLQVVHEEEDRIPVRGTQFEILEALKEMIDDGLVETDESSEKVIFFLKK